MQRARDDDWFWGSDGATQARTELPAGLRRAQGAVRCTLYLEVVHLGRGSQHNWPTSRGEEGLNDG